MYPTNDIEVTVKIGTYIYTVLPLEDDHNSDQWPNGSQDIVAAVLQTSADLVKRRQVSDD